MVVKIMVPFSSYNTAPNIWVTQKGTIILTATHMSYSLNSLKGIIWGIILGTTLGLIRGGY